MFSVLGALRVATGNGTPVAPSAPKQRAVLGLLLLYRRQTVTVDRMIREIWSNFPPDSAVANLRTYIRALRQLLGDEHDRLMTRPGGYQLQVGENDLDVDEFLSTAELGRESLAQGDPRSAHTVLCNALGLWRGRAFEDVPLSRSLAIRVQALEEQRVAAIENLTRAKLMLGDCAAAAAEARGVLSSEPTRESAWCLLIAALHEGGDSAAALRTFQQARLMLIEDLGIEPGPELSKLQTDILQRDAASPSHPR